MKLNKSSEQKFYDIVSELKNQKYVSEDFAYSTNQSESAWYVNGIIGFCAWFSALFILAFIFGTFHRILYDSPAVIMPLGILLCGTAVIITKHPKNKNNIFLNQLSLAICIAGEILFIIGTQEKFHSVSINALITIALQIFLIILYNNYIHRFLSVPAIFVALLIIFKEINAAYLTHPLVFASAFAILKAWSYKQNIFCSKFSDLFAPISYGLSFAFLLTFLIVINKETSLYLEIENWYLSSAAILISLLYFENSAIKKLTLIRKNKFYILVYLFTILLTIATLKSPGIMAAFLIMLISFNYRNIFM
ncbi:MAG TPA: DUF4401 domain-containing protein, partial [bacterium]|nr:DUF4401 domain-containing protein [bacterium]